MFAGISLQIGPSIAVVNDLAALSNKLGADGQWHWRHWSAWLAIGGQLKWRFRAPMRFFAANPAKRLGIRSA